MRKSYLFLLTAAILFSACGGDDVVDEQEREPIITPTPEPEVVKDHVSDLTGVWQSITDDGVYFLAISDKGEVTYCLNRITLGKGTAKFLKDTLKISNDFTDETETTCPVFKEGSLPLSRTHRILFCRNALNIFL